MSKVRNRIPKVFVGHPFKNRFPTNKFRKIFKELPFNVVFGNTDIQTRHLLSIMKRNIIKADYCFYDLSGWNPNVALELGLAEGLKKNSLKNYYILLNTNRSKEVPSDIRGLQRLEYTSYDFTKEKGLGDRLLDVLSKEPLIQKIWKEITNGNIEKKKRLSLRILAHYRENERLTLDNVAVLKRGLNLRAEGVNEVLQQLLKNKIISKKGRIYVRKKKYFTI